ncbi:hypothetical protein [Methylobacterium sp. J-092]|uniref:hypothetical protein n=1 Tax=Methylobacterium sp. J-092 TaxID=2836667 RepID=UPI001FB9CCFB|nr:hypothetical protein [Methylobacterium sp. J-092]MCJ2008454.1 hypothetical protein [Methylobacterium sp. J-092]
MGKQRTPQGRSTGRRSSSTPPGTLQGKTGEAKTGEAKAGEAKSARAAALEAALHPPEESLPPVPSEAPPEPLHAHLMDTVSPEALGTATGTPTSAPEPEAPPAEIPVPADANLAEPAFAEIPNPEAPPVSEPEVAGPAADTAPAPVDEPVPADEPAPVAAAAPKPEAPPAYTNVVPLKSAAPARPPEPRSAPQPGEAPVQLSDGALPSPASWRAGRRPVPALRQDLEGLGETLFAFMRDESSAVLTHLNALKDARSPADAIRLQVNEMQRVADASLTCWSELARRATRIVGHR